MPINFALPKSVELKPRIMVIGVGGAGGNAVNNMIESGLDGVEFIVANTDAQALAMSRADRRIQMGGGITEGLGAGMKPEVGEQSAEDSLPEILEHLEGAHMLFVAAGMGGGTGTGAAPVIARAARERGILTVAIVTKPFSFEGTKRMRLANQGIENLYQAVDTLITIPNQNLFRIATEQTTFADAFGMADEVLNSGVRSVTDLMVVPGLINLDFNDVRTVMDEMGKAMMGTGEATGDRRAVEAAEAAISNPLLDDVSLQGAKGVLINITGGTDLTLFEVDEAAELIKSQVDEDANIIVGSAQDPDLQGIVRVSVVATGVQSEAMPVQTPSRITPLRPVSQAPAQAPVQTAPIAHAVQQMHETIADAFEDEAEEAAAEAPKPYPAQVAPVIPAAPEPAPAPVQAAPVRYTPPAPAQPPAPAPVQDTPKRGFGFFGRRRPLPVAMQAPAAAVPAPAPKPGRPADLFEGTDEELEIPSFLRRQVR